MVGLVLEPTSVCFQPLPQPLCLLSPQGSVDAAQAGGLLPWVSWCWPFIPFQWSVPKILQMIFMSEHPCFSNSAFRKQSEESRHIILHHNKKRVLLGGCNGYWWCSAGSPWIPFPFLALIPQLLCSFVSSRCTCDSLWRIVLRPREESLLLPCLETGHTVRLMPQSPPQDQVEATVGSSA